MKKYYWKWILGVPAFLLALILSSPFLAFDIGDSGMFFFGVFMLFGISVPPFLIGFVLDKILATRSKVSNEYLQAFSTMETGKKYSWKWVLGSVFAFFPAAAFLLGVLVNEFYAESFGNMLCGWFIGFGIGALIDLNAKNKDMKNALVTKHEKPAADVVGTVVELDGKFYRVEKIEKADDPDRREGEVED